MEGLPEGLNISGIANRTATENLSEVLSQLTSLYLAVVIVIGLLGNLYCVVLFSSKGLRRLSSSQYLLALALADGGFLSSLMISWLRTWDIRLEDIPIVCVSSTYLSSICAFMSEWSILAFTAERFVAVSYPLQRKYFCTASRARKFVISLAVISALYNSWVPLTLDLQSREPNDSFICGHSKPELDYIYSVMNLADTFVSFVIPASIALLLNLGIAIKLWRFAAVRAGLTSHRVSLMSSVRQRLRLTKSDDECKIRLKSTSRHLHSYESCANVATRRSTHGRRTTRSGSGSHNARETRITRTLMTVAIVNLLLNLPSYLHRIGAESNRADSTVVTLVLEFLSYCLFYTQFCINFILYSLQGRFKDVRLGTSPRGRHSIVSRISNGSTKV